MSFAFESSLEFAAEFTRAAITDFEVIIADIFQPLIRGEPKPEFSAAQIAGMMVCAGNGFETATQDAAQLRQLIDRLCRLILTGIPTGRV